MADSDPLKFIFQLLDQLSGPAGKMRESLGGVTKALDAGGKGALKFGGIIASLGGKAKDIVSGGLAVAFGNLVSKGIEVAIGAVMKLGSAIAGLGHDMFDAIAGSQRLALTFNTILGKEGASQASNFLNQISLKTEFAKGDLERATGSLISAGYKAEELKPLLAAGLDVANLLGGGAGNLEQAIGALANIKLTGRLDARAIKALRLSPDEVFKQLGDILGKTAAQAEELSAQGKTPVDAALGALFSAIEAKQGGALGSGGAAAGETIMARMTQIKSIPSLFFDAIAESPAVAKLTNVLGGIVAKLSPEGPLGKKIVAGLDKLFGGLVDVFERLTSGGSMKLFERGLEAALDLLGKLPAVLSAGLRFWERMAPTIEAVGSVTMALITVLGALFKVAAPVAEILASLVGLIAPLVGGIGEGVGKLVGALTGWVGELMEVLKNAASIGFQMAAEVGSQIWQGIVQGLTPGLGKVTDTIRGAGNSMITGLKDVLGIQSPSRVFAEIGKNTALGFAGGLDAAGGDIEDAFSRNFDSFGQSLTGPGGGVASLTTGGITFNISIPVNGGAGAADEIAEKLTELAPSFAASIWERLAMQAGA